MGAHRERGMSAPNSPGGGARNRKKFQTAAQLDEAFDNFKAGQKDEDTEKSGKQKMKGFKRCLHLWPNGDAVPFRCNCSAAHNLAEPEHVRRWPRGRELLQCVGDQANGEAK